MDALARKLSEPSMRQHVGAVVGLLKMISKVDPRTRVHVLETMGVNSASDATGRTFLSQMLDDTGDNVGLVAQMCAGLVANAGVRAAENDPWGEADTLNFRAILQIDKHPRMRAVQETLLHASAPGCLKAFESHIRAVRASSTGEVLSAGEIEGACCYARFANTLLIAMANDVTTLFCFDPALAEGRARPPHFDFEPIVGSMRQAAATARIVRVPKSGLAVHNHQLSDGSRRSRLIRAVKTLAQIGRAESAAHACTMLTLTDMASISAEIEECWALISQEVRV